MLRNIAINIGQSIRERRELLGLLQPQLSSIAGVSTRTIQLVEAGKANPSLQTLIQLADAVGLHLQLVLKDKVSENK
ncbi:MAG: helix-turn-helix domain-containing protein [Ginsengibacter sp.]